MIEKKCRLNHSVGENDKITPLLFIILLENALKHGGDSLSDKAYIPINLQSLANGIQFSIENNFEHSEVNQEKGIGLDYLRQRLELTYQKPHELNISEKESIFKVDLKIMDKYIIVDDEVLAHELIKVAAFIWTGT